MLSRLGSVSALVVVVGALPLTAQAVPKPSTRATMRNDVSLELGGKAAIYSFAYQRMVSPSLGLEVGLAALGGGSSGDNTTLVFFPVGAKFYLIPKDGSIFLTAGGVFVTGHFDSGPFDETESSALGYGGLGFEFRSSGGFMIRGTAYGLFGEGGYLIWPGLTIGYAF
jgi:hypothetical protein